MTGRDDNDPRVSGEAGQEGLDGGAFDDSEFDPLVRDRLIGALAGPSLGPVAFARLRARVLDEAGQPPVAIFAMTPDAFKPFFPGVTIRPLRIDRVARTQTSLWRLQPGSSIPEHVHCGEEECLIMEGSITWNGNAYRPGDFLLARPGAHHEPFYSPEGALLMIRSELTAPLEQLFD